MAGCNTREENAAEAQAEFEELKSQRPLMINDRERDTIIAALRYWQHSMEGTSPDMIALIEIAENGREGEGSRLLPEEIDELIEERINT